MKNKHYASIGLAEDQPYVLKGLLENIDWTNNEMEVSFAAENGNVALEHIEKNPPDILITDIRMPGKSGLDLAAFIHKKQLSTKVIILTAYDDFSYAHNAIQCNVYDYLLKPVEYSEVITKCKSALKEKRQEEKIQEHVQKSLPILREKFFLELAQGMLSPKEIEEQTSFLSLPLPHTTFQCGMISAKPAFSPNTKFKMPENEVIMYRIKEYLQETSINGILYLFRLHNRSLAFLFGHSQPLEEARMRLNNLCEKLILDFRTKYLSDITISLGRSVATIHDIPSSFKDVLLVEDYRFRFSNGTIYDYNQLPLSSINADTFPFGLQEQILKWIFLGNWNEAQMNLKKLYQYFSDSHFSRKSICTFYMNTILRLHFQASSANLSFAPETDCMEEITTLAETSWNLDQINAWVEQQCHSMCDIVQDSYEHQYQTLVQQVNDYIKSHYMDHDINLEKIAKYIGMNHTYLSSIYKKNARKGINEVITETRLDSSKKLLTTTNQLIQNIAEDIGFSNQYYFSAWFKKQTGYTPNQYRSNNEFSSK